MNPIKLLRKLGKTLRGGATSRQIFLGVFLGFAIGMTPGLNLTLILLIALLLFLNVNGAMGFLSFVMGKVLCYLLAPVTFKVGYIMIHYVGLIGLVRWMADTPVIALLDWHVYSLIGAIPFIVAIGVPMGVLIARAINKARRVLAASEDKSDAYKKLAENIVMRFFLRVVFGKRKKDFSDMLDAKSPLLRKGRLIGGSVVLIVIVILQWVYMGRIVTAAVAQGLALANGAEVNVDSASLSPATGRLEIHGLQVTDRGRPSHNTVQADLVVADVSVLGLLTRRLVVDVLTCEQMVMDAERDKPGAVYRTGEPTDWKPILPGIGQNEIENAKRVYQRVNKVKEWLESSDPSNEYPAARRQRLAREAQIRGYLRLSAKDFLAQRPMWVIDKLTCQLGPTGPVPTLTLTGDNFSSHPSLHPKKPTFNVTVDEQAVARALAEQVSGGGPNRGLGNLIDGDNDDSDSSPDDADRDGSPLEGILRR